MHWSCSIIILDVAHRLLQQVTLPRSSGIYSQQNIAFKFFTVLIVNFYRIWNLSTNGESIISRLDLSLSGTKTAFDMCLSMEQLLRRSQFHTFVEQVQDILISIPNDRVLLPISDGYCAVLPHLKRRSPAVKRKRNHAANELSTALDCSQRGMIHDQARHDKPRWCVACSIPELQPDGKSKW